MVGVGEVVGKTNVTVGRGTSKLGQIRMMVGGVGVIVSGGSADLTQGYKIKDIEDISLAQANGVPVQVKDVAKVYVGNVPRLGKAGRDKEDEVVAAIPGMKRTLHTHAVFPPIKA